MNNYRRADDRPRSRIVACVLLALLPIAFVAGRVTGPTVMTVRAAEAVPVPNALPIGVERFHDASEDVTCWRVAGQYGGGVSCLPNQWLASARAQE